MSNLAIGETRHTPTAGLEGWPLTRLLLTCGVIAPFLFVSAFLIEGATREGYDPWRHAVSQLSLGEQGWMNVANLIVCGLLILCFAGGLRRALRTGAASRGGPVLMTVIGLALVALGIFPDDPALGYPPGVEPHFTVSGLIHSIAGVVFFASLAATCFVFARRFTDDPDWRGWSRLSVVTGVVVVASFLAAAVVTGLAMSGVLTNAPGGLLQRIAIVSGLGWIALLATRLIRLEGKGTSA